MRHTSHDSQTINNVSIMYPRLKDAKKRGEREITKSFNNCLINSRREHHRECISLEPKWSKSSSRYFTGFCLKLCQEGFCSCLIELCVKCSSFGVGFIWFPLKRIMLAANENWYLFCSMKAASPRPACFFFSIPSRTVKSKGSQATKLKQMADKINFLSISGFVTSIFRDIKVRAIEFRR